MTGNDQEQSKLIVKIVPTDKIPIHKRAAISGICQTSEGIAIQMNHKVKALELLGRHLGLFNDKLTLNSDDELKAHYKSVFSKVD